MGKAALTRQQIVECASKLADEAGLDSLTIGTLATALKMSKSGLFAHFGSREKLQLAVLARGESQFRRAVVLPVLKCDDAAQRWQVLCEELLKWISRPDSGCLFLGAGFEFSGRPGIVRNAVVRVHSRMREFVAGVARENGFHQVDTLTFSLLGILLSLQQSRRLLKDKRSIAHSEQAIQRLSEVFRTK